MSTAQEFAVDAAQWNSLPASTDNVPSAVTSEAPVKEAPAVSKESAAPVSEALKTNQQQNSENVKNLRLPPPKDDVKLLRKDKIRDVMEGRDKLPKEEVEAKVEDKAKEVEQKTEEQKTEEKTDGKQKRERDFTGLEDLDEGQRQLLKNTSVQAFDFVKALVLKERKAAKELSTQLKTAQESIVKSTKENGLPANYFEHPQAYVLSPEYGKSVEAINTWKKEQDHWDAQFEKIERGESWEDVEVDANGNARFVTKDPSSRAKLYTERLANNAHRRVAEEQATALRIQESFSNRIRQRNDLIRQREDVVFPKFKENPELVNTDPHYQTLMKVLKEQDLDSDPLATSFAKLYSYHMELFNAYNKKVSESAKVQSNTEERKAAGPSSGEINKGATGKPAPKEEAKLQLSKFKEIINGAN